MLFLMELSNQIGKQNKGKFKLNKAQNLKYSVEKSFLKWEFMVISAEFKQIWSHLYSHHTGISQQKQ